MVTVSDGTLTSKAEVSLKVEDKQVVTEVTPESSGGSMGFGSLFMLMSLLGLAYRRRTGK